MSGWPRFGSVRLRFGDRTVRAVPVFGSSGSSNEGVFVCFSTVSQRGRFRFRFRFLENGSGGSGSAFGSCENGSDGSGFRFRFGSWASLKCNDFEKNGTPSSALRIEHHAGQGPPQWQPHDGFRRACDPHRLWLYAIELSRLTGHPPCLTKGAKPNESSKRKKQHISREKEEHRD